MALGPLFWQLAGALVVGFIVCIAMMWLARREGQRCPYPGLVVGITGGIASGKSTAARYIQKTKDSFCRVIQVDLLVHKAYEPGTECYNRIVKHFGPVVQSSDIQGKPINRRKLGEIVFADPAEMAKLESFVRPTLIAQVQKLIQQYQGYFVFIESATLEKDGLLPLCSEVWHVKVDRATAKARLQARNPHLDEEQAEARLRFQDEAVARMPNYCQRTIDNNKEPEHLLEQVDEALDSLYGRYFFRLRSEAILTQRRKQKEL